ncbi:MAG: choice-of-anchor B family protein [Bacteroidota bacterium]
MTGRLFLLFLTFYVFTLPSLSSQDSLNMRSLGSWDNNSLVTFGGLQYNDVWGYAAGGREYGIIGSAAFFHVLDITDPSNITEVAQLNNVTNSRSIWRDIKTYQGYAYGVADQFGTAEGLQIIDLNNLPNSASIVYRSTSFFSRAHNIYIDEANAKLYVHGSNTNPNGVIILDISNPTSPSLLANAALTGGYLHDGFVRGDTLYANSESRGLFVYDVSTPTSPRELGRLQVYPEAGYNHSCWLTDNGQYLVFCDETRSTGVKMTLVADPSDMSVTDVFRSTLEAPTATNSLAHNPFILGDPLVVISYYDDGIQVFDITDPSDVVRRAYYDTNLDNNGQYTGDGSWGAYPYLPSGRILASDQLNGLIVLELDGFTAPLPVRYRSWEAKAVSANIRLDWSTELEIDNAGFQIEYSQDGRSFQPLAWIGAHLDGKDTYTYTHFNPGNGTHFYRLRQRDYDGTEALSTVRSVRISDYKVASVYPNPARPGALIYLEPGAYQLFSAAGREIGYFEVQNRALRLPANLPSGIYHLVTATGPGYRFMVK